MCAQVLWVRSFPTGQDGNYERIPGTRDECCMPLCNTPTSLILIRDWKTPAFCGLRGIKMNNKRNGYRWEWYLLCVMKSDRAVVKTFPRHSELLPWVSVFVLGLVRNITSQRKNVSIEGGTWPICSAVAGSFCSWSLLKSSNSFFVIAMLKNNVSLTSELFLYSFTILFRSINAAYSFRFCIMLWCNSTKNTCYCVISRYSSTSYVSNFIFTSWRVWYFIQLSETPITEFFL